MQSTRVFAVTLLSVFCLAATATADWREPARKAKAAAVRVSWEVPAVPTFQPATVVPPQRQYAAGEIIGTRNLTPTKTKTQEFASGTVVRKDGVIVTFATGPGEGGYDVTLSDGRKLKGRLIVDDQRSGLKLLKVDADDLPALKLADAPAEAGQAVIAVAKIFGYEGAVALGIVSGAGRVEGLGLDLLQTDINMAPGSAGAPLVDANGDLLGVVVAKYDRDSSLAISFAAPAPSIRALLKAVSEDQVVIQSGYLGIALTSGGKNGEPVVERVYPGSAADSAGLVKGDLLLKVDGDKIATQEQFLHEMLKRRAGEQVKLELKRGDEELQIVVTLDARPKGAVRRPAHHNPFPTGPQLYYYFYGKDGKLQQVSPKTQQQLFKQLNKAYQTLPQQPVDRPVAPKTPYQPAPAPPTEYKQAPSFSPRVVTPSFQVQTPQAQQLEALTKQVEGLRKQIERLSKQLQELDKD